MARRVATSRMHSNAREQKDDEVQNTGVMRTNPALLRFPSSFHSVTILSLIIHAQHGIPSDMSSHNSVTIMSSFMWSILSRTLATGLESRKTTYHSSYLATKLLLIVLVRMWTVQTHGTMSIALHANPRLVKQRTTSLVPRNHGSIAKLSHDPMKVFTILVHHARFQLVFRFRMKCFGLVS